MTPAEKIIERFGGIAALARALGHKQPSTVQGWKERGFIPARRQALVLAAARDQYIELTPADFFASDAALPGLEAQLKNLLARFAILADKHRSAEHDALVHELDDKIEACLTQIAQTGAAIVWTRSEGLAAAGVVEKAAGQGDGGDAGARRRCGRKGEVCRRLDKERD